LRPFAVSLRIAEFTRIAGSGVHDVAHAGGCAVSWHGRIS
jgi:hypothetical protein